jgi:hypothetical protein
MIEGSGTVPVPRTNGFGSDSGSATLAAFARLCVIIIVVKIHQPPKKKYFSFQVDKAAFREEEAASAEGRAQRQQLLCLSGEC